MTSILTNTSAMVALQTLRTINDDLNATNDRISTGLRIGKAEDSAAYWAIATTTKSDNGALGAVSDALGLGRTTVDVAYQGLEAAREGLQDMKELLVSARSPGVDRGNIQTQIAGIITDLQNKAGASVINEQNWLAVDSSAAGYNADRTVVASFERTTTGVSLSTISLTISNADPSLGIALTDGNAAGSGILDEDRTVGGTTNNVLAVDISALTDSAADLTTLEETIGIVDAALEDTIGAMNRVGVVLSRIDSQMEFVSALMDANDRAVGTLVDANMEEESTRLRALQTQQQLAIQSLGIANQSSNNVLQLFR